MAADPSRFVNPYAFIPFPTEAADGSPVCVRMPAPKHRPTHEQAAAKYSGTIEVSWTLQTPMLLPSGYETSGVIDGGGHVVIPGSSIKGATRALHEAMFNGCLRIIDQDFTPGYRDAATSDAAKQHEDAGQWRLALVTRDVAGVPTEVRLCTDEVWIDSGELRRSYGRTDLPRTGDIVHVDVRGAQPNSLGRNELRAVGGVKVLHSRASGAAELATVSGRIFLPTDTGTRRKQRRNPLGGTTRGRCFWASGELEPDATPTKIAPLVSADFRSSVEGSEDRRILRAAMAKENGDSWTRATVFKVVKWWLPNGGFGPVAARAQHSGLLWAGDVVWARVDNKGEVNALRLSHGEHSVKDRTPPELLPCNPADARGLCLTCSIFGAVDETGDDRGKGAQEAYAAHVRFGSARTTDPVESKLRAVQLTPMGAPKPGAGMFYLRNTSHPGRTRVRGDRAAEWGSQVDGNARRSIAGRKFYWHSDPDQQAKHWDPMTTGRTVPRYEAVGKQRTSEMSSERRLVPAGTVLSGRVTFDLLDELSLRTLIWSLNPGPVLSLAPGRGDATFGVHLGGGKPLGLGSAIPTVSVSVSSVAERYRCEAAPSALDLTGPRAAREDLLSLRDRTGHFLAAVPFLARMLDMHGLGEDEVLVSYPPAATWRQADIEDFRKSYEFFVAADGERLADRVNPWHPLPSPAHGADVTLPIEPGAPT